MEQFRKTHNIGRLFFFGYNRLIIVLVDSFKSPINLSTLYDPKSVDSYRTVLMVLTNYIYACWTFSKYIAVSVVVQNRFKCDTVTENIYYSICEKRSNIENYRSEYYITIKL